MSYKAKKSAFDYTKKINHIFMGSEIKVPMVEMANYIFNTVDDSFDFIVCLEKLNEDWDLTEAIGKYTMGEVVNLLVDYPDAEYAAWKAETIKTLEGWLKVLKS